MNPASNKNTLTLKRTFHLIKTDYRKASICLNMKMSLKNIIFMAVMPSIVAVTLYRFSRFFYVKNIKPLSWLFWMANIYITGAEFLPYSDIGGYLYVAHSVGTKIAAKIGQNATLLSDVGIGGGRSEGDIGGGPGVPVIGDDFVGGVKSTILGTIKIGNNVTVGAASLVLKDIPDNATVVGSPARIVESKKDMEYLRPLLIDKDGNEILRNTKADQN
jgi:serine O-acetyltransferase